MSSTENQVLTPTPTAATRGIPEASSSSSLAKRGFPKNKSTASLRARTESTGSYGSPIKSRQFAKLQRQLSRDTPEGRERTKSTSSEVSYIRARSASLSLAHADCIPFEIAPPTADDVDPDEVPWWTSKRLMLSFVCFVGFFCLYSLRVNLSTAIVCMVKTNEKIKLAMAANATNSTFSNMTYSDVNSTGGGFSLTTMMMTTTTEMTLQCPEPNSEEGTALVPEFEWDKKLQGFILGAFFWGYTIMQMPSGFLSDRFGPRLTIACGMFPVAILTIISPWLARGSPYLLLIGRVAIGFGEAMMYPGMQSLWSKWAPPHERSRLVGFAFGGSQLGNALTFPFASLLCAYGFDGGWPSVFYVLGFVGFLWCCWFVFFARDSPGQMTTIKPVERKYIEQSLGTWGQSVEDRLKARKHKKPWKKIFTSGPVWAILLTNACSNYGAYMVLTQLPTFMKEVLHFDIKSNGLFSMIPFLVFWIFVILAGQMADVLISKKILSIEWTRKLCGAIGCVLPGLFLVLTGYMDCNHQTEAVVLLTLAMAFCGFQFSAFFINHGDIAPRYAGTVFGFTNCGASVPGILAPYIVGAVTPNKTREEWLIAFYIAAAIYMIGAIIYVVLAKGEVQDWAHEDVEEWENKGEDYPLKGISEEHEHEHDDEEKSKLTDDRKNGVMFE